MPELIAGKGGGPSPFVNAFRAPQLNSLRYNTSQFGSPVFIAYGTCRISVNVIEYWGFAGSGGGGKGGKGLGRSAGKKGSNQRYQVNVAFALCQGPVSFTGASNGSDGDNRIWSNGGIAAGLRLEMEPVSKMSPGLGGQGTAGDSRGRTWQQIARRGQPVFRKSCAIIS